MRYECPSCKMQWKDDLEPQERLSHPLCVFCSSKHTQKELLNWQMDHLETIDPKHFPLVIRHFYRYVEHTVKSLDDKLYDQAQQSRQYSQGKHREDCPSEANRRDDGHDGDGIANGDPQRLQF